MSETGQSGRKTHHDYGHAARAGNRAIAAVGFNARLMLGLADKFKLSPAMADLTVRAAAVQQVKEAILSPRNLPIRCLAN